MIWIGTILALLSAMLKKFVVFNLSSDFYRECKTLKVPIWLREQLQRASSSVALNIAEGAGRRTPKEKRRFYSIALGSLRECQAIFEIEDAGTEKAVALADQIAAILFTLTRPDEPVAAATETETAN